MSKAVEDQTREELIATVGQLQFRLNELERMIFGRKSERFVPSVPSTDPLQMGLFGNLPSVAAPEPVKEHITYERQKPKAKNANHPRRQTNYHLQNHHLQNRRHLTRRRPMSSRPK